YATAVGSVSTDVVLHHEAVSRTERTEVLRHECGHVVTLAGTNRGSDAIVDVDNWLKEGIAEYVAYAPRPGRETPRLGSVRAGKAPTTVVLEPLLEKAGGREGDRFYGLGHLSVDCFARRYGEAKLFAFVRLRLREQSSLEEAAQQPFGRPFRD